MEEEKGNDKGTVLMSASWVARMEDVLRRIREFPDDGQLPQAMRIELDVLMLEVETAPRHSYDELIKMGLSPEVLAKHDVKPD